MQFQADYIRDLVEATDYPMFDLDDSLDRYLSTPERMEIEEIVTGRGARAHA